MSLQEIQLCLVQTLNANESKEKNDNGGVHKSYWVGFGLNPTVDQSHWVGKLKPIVNQTKRSSQPCGPPPVAVQIGRMGWSPLLLKVETGPIMASESESRGWVGLTNFMVSLK